MFFLVEFSPSCGLKIEEEGWIFFDGTKVISRGEITLNIQET